MAKKTPKTHEQINKMSQEELYHYGNGVMRALEKRARRLEENFEKNPGKYSKFGYYALVGDEEKGIQGIAPISKKDSLNVMRAKVAHNEHLSALKTSTSRGAKKEQERQVRQMLDLPQEGPITAGLDKTAPDYSEQVEEINERYKDGWDYVETNEDALKAFWESFNAFEAESMYRGLDSDRLLDEFRPVFDNFRKSGGQTIDDMIERARKHADDYYIQQAVKQQQARDAKRGR